MSCKSSLHNVLVALTFAFLTVFLGLSSLIVYSLELEYTELTKKNDSQEVILSLSLLNKSGFQEGSIFTNSTLSSASHTCSILDNGSVSCWGSGEYGQLGNGGTTNRYSPTLTSSLGPGRTAVAISSGKEHTCAILDNGSVSCWGRGLYGRLGNGGTTDQTTPTLTTSLGQGRTAVAISSGSWHTCAILDNGSVSCWGLSGYGMLGNGQTSNQHSPMLTSSLGPGRTAVAISSGKEHTCAILDNGSVSCWGRGFTGALGGGGTADHTTPTLTSSLGAGRTAVAISAGDQHTCAILDNGSVSCWGFGYYGLGSGGTTNLYSPTQTHSLGIGRTAVAISSGGYHTCVVLDNGSVSCWGRGLELQLGDGETNRKTTPTLTSSLGAGRTAVALASGNEHTCVLLDNASVKCWGEGNFGRLGSGETTDQPTPMFISSLGTGRTVALSERDLDGDGILNIFDPNPYSSANVSPTNWTLSPINGPHFGGTQLNISGDFSWIYDSLENTSSSQGPINHTWSESTTSVPYLRDVAAAIDSDDNIHLAYIRSSQLRYMVNSNGNWSTPLTIDNVSTNSPCSIAVDSQGNPHIAYWNGSLQYITSTNGIWSQPAVFDQVSSSSSHQNIFIDGSDKVYILYHNSSDASLSVRVHDGVEWSSTIVDDSSYATFSHAERASMFVDLNEVIHVAYFRKYGNTNFELMYSTFNGTGWSNSSVEASLTRSSGVSILSDSNSVVHVAYGSEKSSNTDGVDLVHAMFSEEEWESSVVDAYEAGSGTALTADPEDNLYLLYTVNGAAYGVYFASFDGTVWDSGTLGVEESHEPKLQLHIDSSRNLFGIYRNVENAGEDLAILVGTSNYTPSSVIEVDFRGYGNVTATFVNNTTITVMSPQGPSEGGNATVTVWFEGQGYQLSTPFNFLPEAIEDDDSDGVPNNMDDCLSEAGNSTQDRVGCPDLDGDGYSDLNDAFPSDSTEWNDTDSDGTGDNSDLFPADPNEQSDSDNDGVGDNGDAFPSDPTEWNDSDQDGVGDNSDAFPNNPAENSDSDSDGVGDNADAFPNDANETVDSDNDGVGDNQDAFPNDANETADADGDGLGDNEDEYPYIHNFIDSDEDGYPDLFDDFVDDPTQWSDFDGDGFGDFLEGNNPDAFINNATQWSDTDGDGYGDNWGNETWNLTRLFIWPGQFVFGAELADHCPTEFGNSTAEGYFGCPDLDGDGIADKYDDMIELDANNTTNETTTSDTDDDGVEDLFDLCPNTVAGGYVDIDGCLLDEDGDGVDDITDACPGTPTGVAVNITGCSVENEVEKSFMQSLRAGEQEAVLRTVGFGAVLIAVLGFLQTNMVAALLPDSLRWIRVFRTGVKLNQEEIRELEYLKSLVQTYYLDIETLHEELYQLKSELSARYTNSEIKKLTKEKLGTLIDDLLNMDVGEVHRVAHNDAFFGLGGALSTQQRTDYLAQEALMRVDDDSANLPSFESGMSSNELTHPKTELKGEMNENDGYEYLEHPSGSGNWYYRQRSNDEWNEWTQ